MPGGINPGQYPADLTPTDPNVQAALDQALRAFNLPTMAKNQLSARPELNPMPVADEAKSKSGSMQRGLAPTFRQPLTTLSANVPSTLSPTNANGKRPADAMDALKKAEKDIMDRAIERFLNQQSSRIDDDNDDDECDSDSSDDGPIPITHNCDQIRRMITRLLDSKEMTAKALIEKLSVSGPGYYRFMKLNGRDKGYGSDTYVAALKFFQKREKKGIKIGANKNKKAKTSVAASKSQTTLTSSGGTSRKNAGVGAAKAGASASAEVPPVVLEGELENAVEVYDTCSTIRRKINAHLKKDGVTQAAFLRELAACYHPPKTMQSSQLQRFRQMNGVDGGNTSSVYYAAYVFFEKERIRTGTKKSKDREEMEEIYEVV